MVHGDLQVYRTCISSPRIPGKQNRARFVEHADESAEGCAERDPATGWITSAACRRMGNV